MTDAYRARLLAARDRAVGLVLELWRARIDLADLDASARPWLPAATRAIVAGQREAVMLSSAYVGSYLSSELGERVPAPEIDAEAYAGRTSHGRDVAYALGGAIIGTKVALARGRPPVEALASGAARAVRLARSEVVDAGRSALADALEADDRIVGYRRVTSGRRSCGACLALASGELRRTSRRLAIHASCRCTAEPVVRGVPDRVQRPTGKQIFESLSTAEQDALFAGRGGKQKAELLRSGAVEFDDLIAEGTQPGTITEAPLEAVL